MADEQPKTLSPALKIAIGAGIGYVLGDKINALEDKILQKLKDRKIDIIDADILGAGLPIAVYMMKPLPAGYNTATAVALGVAYMMR